MNRSVFLKWLPGAVCVVLLGLLTGVHWVLATRMAALDSAQQEILKQLPEIKALLQGRPGQQAPAPSAITDMEMAIKGAPIKGNADAKLIVIEFSDFECPFCGRFTGETYPHVEKNYINTGKIRYVFRHYPLERIHPRALKAGEAGECAHLQGKFWPMHDRLFANQKLLDPPALLDHARAVGLDATAFEACLNGQVTATIRADLDIGSRLGITGTPTFFLGFARQDGTVHVVEKIVGAQPFEVFQSTLDRMLESAEASR